MPARVLPYLERYGPQGPKRIELALGLSPSSIRRAVSAARDHLLVVGRARATTYAARRTIPGLRTPVPVYEISLDGHPRHLLTLHPVAPFGHYVEAHADHVQSGFHGTKPATLGLDLPWFLHDARPSGFFGRAWLHTHPDHGYPADLARWTGDHVLRYAADHGTDLVGALVVGPVARDRLAERPPDLDAIDEAVVARALPDLARRATTATPGGSSPGGEQPKFTLRVRLPDGSVRWELVKFSPPLGTPGGRRWADLLLAEHLAHAVVQDHGIEAARSEIVDASDRRYLRVVRFDRHGATGRSGLVSLAPLDVDGVADTLRRWSLVTARLLREGRLSARDHERVVWLETFGHAIGNTDMHAGNLSLRLGGTTLTGLAPVYDMLPMAFAPRHGGELPAEVRGERELDGPASAKGAGRELWGRVAEDGRVSDAFRRVAASLTRAQR